MSEKLFDLGQKVMELENELETEKRSHAGECRDMRERFEREFEKQERDYEQRERAYERKIDELARALEREREKHNEVAPRYTWVEGVGMVPQSPRAPPSRATIVTASQTRCTPTLAPVISVGSAPLLSSQYGGIVPNVSVQQTLHSTTAASSTAPTVTTVMSNQSWPRRLLLVPILLCLLLLPSTSASLASELADIVEAF